MQASKDLSVHRSSYAWPKGAEVEMKYRRTCKDRADPEYQSFGQTEGPQPVDHYEAIVASVLKSLNAPRKEKPQEKPDFNKRVQLKTQDIVSEIEQAAEEDYDESQHEEDIEPQNREPVKIEVEPIERPHLGSPKRLRTQKITARTAPKRETVRRTTNTISTTRKPQSNQKRPVFYTKPSECPASMQGDLHGPFWVVWPKGQPLPRKYAELSYAMQRKN